MVSNSPARPSWVPFSAKPSRSDVPAGRGPRARRLRTCFLPVVPFLAVSLASACGEEPALQVGDVAFQEDDLRGLSPERREALATLAAFGQAVADGRLREVAEPLLERGRRAELERMLADEVILEAAGVGEAHLRQRYEEDPEYELEVRHIIFVSERWRPDEHREGARQAAESALERARVEEFPSLAAELSEEPGAAEREGLLQPGREGTWVPEFWEAASRLEEGEISGVVETEYGFHVLRLERRSTVPFEEARAGVLREAARSVGEEGAWDEWAHEAVADLEPDTEMLERWRTGEAQEGDTIARWPGGALTVREFERHAATLPEGDHRALREGDTDRLAEETTGAARTHLLAARARERGLEVEEGAEAELLRDWELDAERWSVFLGFGEELRRGDVRRAALDALAATGQNASIARDELARRGPLLRHSYPARPRDGER